MEEPWKFSFLSDEDVVRFPNPLAFGKSGGDPVYEDGDDNDNNMFSSIKDDDCA